MPEQPPIRFTRPLVPLRLAALRLSKRKHQLEKRAARLGGLTGKRHHDEIMQKNADAVLILVLSGVAALTRGQGISHRGEVSARSPDRAIFIGRCGGLPPPSVSVHKPWKTTARSSTCFLFSS
jgi:hypothetical protein